MTAPSKTANPAAPVPAAPAFRCDFCRRPFRSESRWISHLCEKKRRALQREERFVNLGFHAYQRFWAKRMNPRHKPGWEAFDKSSLYGAFTRFGRYILDNDLINPAGFVDFLLRAEVKLDHWCQPTYYQSYMREMTKLEPPWEAMERTILLLKHWEIETRQPWFDFFRKVATPQAVLWIITGRLSPWILFTAGSAGQLFTRFGPEQRSRVDAVIDEAFWRIKMERHKTEVAEIVATLLQYQL
jgi:hypothetical protein